MIKTNQLLKNACELKIFFKSSRKEIGIKQKFIFKSAANLKKKLNFIFLQSSLKKRLSHLLEIISTKK